MSASVTPLRPDEALPEAATDASARLHAEAVAAARTAEDAIQALNDSLIEQLVATAALQVCNPARADLYRRQAAALASFRQTVTILRQRHP